MGREAVRQENCYSKPSSESRGKMRKTFRVRNGGKKKESKSAAGRENDGGLFL